MSIQSAIKPAPLEKLVVRSIFDDDPFIKNKDALRGAHRAESMSDDNGGSPLTNQSHVLLNDGFRLIIKRTRRFVEDENTRIRD